MNANRRKRIAVLTAELERIKEDIESLRDDEQVAFENLPENFQEGDRGEAMETAIENLDYAADDAQECLDHLWEALG